MRQLLLLRHAKSSSGDPTISDHARPLNERGRELSRRMQAVMQGLGLAPELVLVSSSRRTRQTLQAFEPWPDDARPLIRPLDSLYLASADQLLAVLRAVGDEVGRVMVVAHNPGLHDLGLALLGPSAEGSDAERLTLDFPTSALAEFSFAAGWSALAPGADQLRLVRFLCPKDLPEMAR